MSTLYHAIAVDRAKRVFKVLDHSCIYLFIAGSATPFCLISLAGFKRRVAVRLRYGWLRWRALPPGRSGCFVALGVGRAVSSHGLVRHLVPPCAHRVIPGPGLGCSWAAASLLLHRVHLLRVEEGAVHTFPVPSLGTRRKRSAVSGRLLVRYVSPVACTKARRHDNHTGATEGRSAKAPSPQPKLRGRPLVRLSEGVAEVPWIFGLASSSRSCWCW